MIPPAEQKDLPIILYNPLDSSTAGSLQRHAALSHAAKVTAARRKRYKTTRISLSSTKAPPSRGNTVQPVYRIVLQRQVSPEDVDPFNSLPVKVTPEVSMLVELWINFLASDAINPKGKGRLTVAIVLNNELQARSLLYMCSALLSLRYRDSVDVQVQFMRYRQHCFEYLLRLRTHESVSDNPELLEGLIQTFAAACFANDQIEARLHAGQLIRELKTARKANALSDEEQFFVLGRTHYWDVQCALYYAHAPIIDPEATAYIWQPHFQPCAKWLETHDTPSGDVQSAVVSDRLKYLFTKLQEYIYLQRVGGPELRSTDVSWLVLASPVMSMHILANWFFHHQSIAECNVDNASNAREREVWHLESLLTTAGLAFLASAIHCTFVEPALSRRCAAIFGKLQDLLSNFYPGKGGLDVDEYQVPQLWTLYMGTIWEWESGVHSSEASWYVPNLRYKLIEFGIDTWAAFESLMNDFLRIPAKERVDVVWFLGADHQPAKTGNKRQRPSTDYIRELLFPHGYQQQPSTCTG